MPGHVPVERNVVWLHGYTDILSWTNLQGIRRERHNKLLDELVARGSLVNVTRVIRQMDFRLAPRVLLHPENCPKTPAAAVYADHVTDEDHVTCFDYGTGADRATRRSVENIHLLGFLKFK